MITKFKIFEGVENNYMLGKDQFFINDVIKYLGVSLDSEEFDEDYTLESIYNINVINFFKEILINKTIIFKNINKLINNPIIKGKVKDVDCLYYKDDFYINVTLSNIQILSGEKYIDFTPLSDKSFLVDSDSIVSIYDYDADTKPLHKEVKFKKKVEKYNI